MLVLALEFVGTFFRPAASAMLPQIVPREDLPQAAGLFQSSSASAQLIGLLSGGFLVGLLGAPLLFLLNGITFVTSVIGVGLVRIRETVAPTSKDATFLREWSQGMREITGSRGLVRILAASLVVNFALAPLTCCSRSGYAARSGGAPETSDC